MSIGNHTRLVRLATAFSSEKSEDDGVDVTFELPENISEVSDEDLEALNQKALDIAENLYDPDAEIGSDEVALLQQLAEASEIIRAEVAQREEVRAQNRAEAEEAVSRIVSKGEDESADDEPEAETDDEVVEETEVANEPELEPVAASSKPISISLSKVNRRRPVESTPEPEPEPKRLTLVAAADLPGVPSGSDMTVEQAAQAFLDRSRSINVNSLRASAKAGKRTVQSFSIGSVQKHFPKELQVTRESDADEVLRHAVDESRLPGGSLVASGAGWCSPSEVMYELAEEAETTDGLFSLPEVQVPRGGLKHTLGPDFQSIFTEDSISWNYTEDEVEAGDYDGYGGGSKPMFFVECPEFTEDRLDVAGVGIRAGLLQERAYPETIQRLVRGALVAHEFKMARRKLDRIKSGSTAVTMPANPMGATAPTLDAIELQVEDYRQRHRIGRTRSLEAVFPMWVRGAMRSDLARRLGVDMLSVSNEMINGWFTQRGVNAQFVYELDDLTGAANARTSWPDSFDFLLYLSGTWISGTQAVITLESVYDSALVEQNIYTQLFTEEGWLVAKRFHDSRLVTVNICTDGMTRAGFEGVTTTCEGAVTKEA